MKHVSKVRARFLCAIALTLAFTGAVFGEQDPPRLEAEDEILSLDFTDSTIREVLEAIGDEVGLQFLFDDKVDLGATTSVSLSDTTVLDALRFVAQSNRLFYVVRGSQSVFIAPDTRQKRQEHMPQGMRTFQLDHADPQTVITVLRSLLQPGNLVHDDQLNTVTMEDTFGQLDIAEEIIDRLDRESDEAPDIRAVDREPFWIGTEFSQDLRSRGDSIPRLELDMEQEVTLDLDNSTVRQVFETLGNVAGIQFVFALEIDRSQPASFALSKMSVQEALDTVNQRLGTFSVVWDSRTVFIAPDSPGRRLAEENVAIQFFYLSHADPRKVITALRSLIPVRQTAVIPRLNAVVIKETVVKLEAAQEVVEGLDRADAKTVSDAGS
jgi:type II secretory pathway component GspD/PulD (secretin)